MVGVHPVRANQPSFIVRVIRNPSARRGTSREIGAGGGCSGTSRLDLYDAVDP
jgi:hypothetical protein